MKSQRSLNFYSSGRCFVPPDPNKKGIRSRSGHVQNRSWMSARVVHRILEFVRQTISQNPQNQDKLKTPAVLVCSRFERYAEYFFPTPMPKPLRGPQTPTYTPPSALRCWVWSMVSAKSIRFFGVLQGLNYEMQNCQFCI